MKRHLLFSLTLLLTAVSCQKEFTSSIDLAVTDTQINIESPDEGSCVITVYSNTDWQAYLDPASADWARIGNSDGLRESGSSLGFIHFAYGENDTGADRSATITIQSKNKTVKVTLTQYGQ